MSSAKISKLQSIASGGMKGYASGSDSENEDEKIEVKQRIIKHRTDELKVQVLEERKHMLHRPDMYIGSVRRIKSSGRIWVLENGKFRCREAFVVEGLLRVFMEAISNAIDNIWRSKQFKIPCTTIRVEINRETGVLSVWNDGKPISCEKHETLTDEYNPEVMFGRFRSGTNYDDSEERKTVGRNGEGIKIALVFARWFKINLFNRKEGVLYEQKWIDNMETKQKPIIDRDKKHFPEGKDAGYTLVQWLPDYKRFDLPSGIDDDMLAVMEKTIHDYALMAAQSGVQVFYNDKLVPVHDFKSYVNLYYDDSPEELIEFKSDDCRVIAAPKADPLFKGDLMHVAFVNGLLTTKGGVHVDAWDEAIFRPIVNKINGVGGGKKKAVKKPAGKKKPAEKKKPLIDITHVRKYFSLFVIAEVDNPTFTGQNKDYYNSPEVNVNVKPSDIKKLMKWEFVQRIEDSIKLKEFASLKDAGKKKRNSLNIPQLEDANFAGDPKRGKECILIFCEGDSAASYAAIGMQFGLDGKIGQDKLGVFSLRGKCLGPDTEVLLWNGTIKLAKNIAVGDKLIDDSGMPCDVQNITSGEDDMYEIYNEESQVSYKVNSQHTLTVKLSEHGEIHWHKKHNRWSMKWFDPKEHRIKTKTVNVIDESLDHPIPEKMILAHKAVQDWVDNKYPELTQKQLGEKFDVSKGWVQTHAIHCKEKIECRCGGGMGQNQITRSRLSKAEAYDEIIKFRKTISPSNIFDVPLQTFLNIPLSKRLRGFRSSGIEWPEKDVKLDPYMMGMWLGDGDSSGYGFTTADPELLEAWKSWSQEHKAEVHPCGSSGYHYNICAIGNSAANKSNPNPLACALRHYNLINNKHIPKDYYVNSRKVRLALLAGMIDTDGYLVKDGRIEIAQGLPNQRIAHELVPLIKSLGFHCTIRDHKTSWTSEEEKKTGMCKRIMISGNGLRELPTKLPRKISSHLFKQDPLRYELKIRKLERGPYCGFEVSGSHRFLLGDFSVTHNCLNVRNAGVTRILKNKEIIGTIRALGLEYGADYTDLKQRNKLRYGQIYMMSDSDNDGSHVTGLVLNLIHTLFPSLLDTNDFFHFLRVPIVKISMKHEQLSFLFYHASQQYLANNPISNRRIKYFKGLGTFKPKDIAEDFGRYPVALIMTDKAQELLPKVFGKDDSNFRKEWLLQYQDKIMERKVPDFEVEQLPIEKFLDDELRVYSIESCLRGIPRVIDGLKESTCKVLNTAIDEPLNYNSEEMKVVQLAGAVAKEMGYHHGEQNIPSIIIKMAQSFPGSNNIPLFYASGHFGSRQGGKKDLAVGDDASAGRYIFTKLEMLTRLIFRPEDDEYLPNNVQDGKIVEKKYYMPIIPMVLVNGASGIGTAHSSTVPQYNPFELMDWIDTWLEKQGKIKTESNGLTFYETPPLVPYYRGFTGKIEADGSKITIKGVMEQTNKNEWTITELPLGRLNVSIKKYRTKLEKFKDEKKIKSFTSQKHDLNKPFFTITADPDGIIPNLQNMKLIDTISTTNMVLFNEESKLMKFESVEAILEYYCRRRYDFYTIRMNGMLQALRLDLKWASNKIRFIRLVHEKKLEIRDRDEQELDDEMVSLKFDKQPKVKRGKQQTKAKPDQEEDVDDEKESKSLESFDYLLNMKIACLNIASKAYKELEKKKLAIDAQIKDIESTTVEALWRREMKELKEAYAKWEKRMADDAKVPKRGKKAKSTKGKKSKKEVE